ncbi:SMODS domain-containing nucleotidyltransferase [Rhodococcus globerulus]|uniref:SMODS domain-containing nucleotidyltransferase n=1 Tax=Rhodococcus globerulus TaxID=33008 RepID=UPI003018FF5C
MSTSDRFDKFLRNITLTTAEREQATARGNNVAEKLHSHFYPSRAYNGDTKLLIGSHGKRTRVRPVRDVDIIFKMPPPMLGQYHRHSGNGQSALLQVVKNVLLTRFPSTTIKGDGPVVKAEFSTGHTVEVVPAFAVPDSSQYLIPHTQNGGKWALSSYMNEFDYLEKSDKSTDGQTRRLIKMIKIWQQANNVPIKSLCIELRAINFLNKWEHAGKPSNWDDWMIRDFLQELIVHVNNTCTIPGTEEEYKYGDKWLPKAKLAYANAQQACVHESDKSSNLAEQHWIKVFGVQFVRQP